MSPKKSEPINRTLVLVAVITLIGTITAAIFRSTWLPILLRTTPVSIGTPIATPVPKIRIVAPNNGESVESSITVQGTSESIPKGQEIWVLVYPKVLDSFYYPQNGRADLSTNGGWSSPATIGIYKEDIGRQFDIVVVLANQEAQRAFKTNPRFTRLPDDALIYDRIIVTRK